MQSKPAEAIIGDTYEDFDEYGNSVKYVFGNEVFYDYEEGFIYFELGLINCDSYVSVIDPAGLKTEPITSSGVLRSRYSYASAPEMFGVSGEGFENRDISANIIEGTTQEAQEWLSEKYKVEEKNEPLDTYADTTVPPEPEKAPVAEAIVGKWEACESYTNFFNGDEHLNVFEWEFTSYGTYCFSLVECRGYSEMPGDYYKQQNGMFWVAEGGSGHNGSYTLDGNILTVTHSVEGEPGVEKTEVYTVEVDGDTLYVYGEWLPSTYTRS